jgi:hypothetical protein
MFCCRSSSVKIFSQEKKPISIENNNKGDSFYGLNVSVNDMTMSEISQELQSFTSQYTKDSEGKRNSICVNYK